MFNNHVILSNGDSLENLDKRLFFSLTKLYLKDEDGKFNAQLGLNIYNSYTNSLAPSFKHNLTLQVSLIIVKLTVYVRFGRVKD